MAGTGKYTTHMIVGSHMAGTVAATATVLAPATFSSYT